MFYITVEVTKERLNIALFKSSLTVENIGNHILCFTLHVYESENKKHHAGLNKFETGHNER